MKSSMKTVLGFIVFLCLFAFSGKAVLTSYAAASGTCGDDLTWTLSDDGTLTIEGEGAMDNYTVENDQPWGSQRNSIKKVVIKEGVTSIGNLAFYGCTSLESLTIRAKSSISIGENTFANCSNLQNVNLIGEINEWSSLTGNLPDTVKIHYFVSVSVGVNNSAFGTASIELGGDMYEVSNPMDPGGTRISISAMPEEGCVFAGWERNGQLVSTENLWMTNFGEMRDYQDGEEDRWHLALTAIFKKDLTITAADQNPVYNGKPQGFDGTDNYINYLSQVSVIGLNSGDSISGLKLTGQGTYVGSEYAIIPSDVKVQNVNNQDVTDQYNIKCVNGKITIKKAPLEISARNKTFPYCGKETGIGDTVYNDPAEIAEMVTVGKLQGSDYLYSIQVFGQAAKTGLHQGVIEPSNAVIYNTENKDVTENYQISYFNADLTITDSPPGYDVEIKPGANMTKTDDSGELSQIVTGAITPVVFTADSGYYFPEDYKAGPENGIIVARSSESRITVSGTPKDHVELILPDAEQKAEPPVLTFTVSFDANGGNGSMDPVTGVSGEYKLPKCLFTAPEGKAFDCWLADGATYGEGDPVNVDADITVTAQWKDVPPEPHVHELTLVQAARATCTEAGNTAYYVCGTCGRWFEDKTALVEITDKSSVIIKALGHKWDEGTVTKEPTEKEEGVLTYICLHDSSHKKTERIPVKAHEHSLTKVDSVMATCTEDGNEAYYVCGGCGLWFEDPAGTKEITDKSSVIIKALGHKLTHVSASSPTCTENGNSDYYICNACSLWFRDSAAKDQITDKSSVIKKALGHEWDRGVITKAATFTRDGMKTYTCLRDSSHTKTELIPKRERRDSNNDDQELGAAPAEDAWLMDGAGWHYRENGVLVKNAWRKLSYNGTSYWYLFDENGTMKTGWAEWNGERYYLSPVSNGWMGHMLTGWQVIDGKWYYFETAEGNTQGRMYHNEKNRTDAW